MLSHTSQWWYGALKLQRYAVTHIHIVEIGKTCSIRCSKIMVSLLSLVACIRFKGMYISAREKKTN